MSELRDEFSGGQQVRGRTELWLFLAQRLSALVMIPLTLAHLATIIYAVQDGLSAAEILGRTRGDPIWPAFYGLFVVAAGIHGAIGLRAILSETLPLSIRACSGIALLFLVGVLALGIRAVEAIT